MRRHPRSSDVQRSTPADFLPLAVPTDSWELPNNKGFAVALTRTKVIVHAGSIIGALVFIALSMSGIVSFAAPGVAVGGAFILLFSDVIVLLWGNSLVLEKNGVRTPKGGRLCGYKDIVGLRTCQEGTVELLLKPSGTFQLAWRWGTPRRLNLKELEKFTAALCERLGEIKSETLADGTRLILVI